VSVHSSGEDAADSLDNNMDALAYPVEMIISGAFCIHGQHISISVQSCNVWKFPKRPLSLCIATADGVLPLNHGECRRLHIPEGYEEIALDSLMARVLRHWKA
jgi:hypothetical protein